MKGDKKMFFEMLEKEMDGVRLGYYALTGETQSFPIKAVWTADTAATCDNPKPNYLSLPITVFLPAVEILDEEGIFYSHFDTARITFDARRVNDLVAYVKNKLADNEERSSYVLPGTMSCGETIDFEEETTYECNVCITNTANVAVRVIGKKIMVVIAGTNGSLTLVKNEVDGSFIATIRDSNETE